MYTMAAPVILVVSYGTTRLLSNSPAHYLAEASHQTNYVTSQLYHGFLMGMGCTILGLMMSFLRLCPQKDIINPDGTIPIPIKKPWYNYNLFCNTVRLRSVCKIVCHKATDL